MKEKTKKFITAVSVFFILIFLLALLNRTGSLILFWKEEPAGSITHDAGNAWYAFVRDENISVLRLPFFLKEDDQILSTVPLSVNEDITVTIKESGGGAYHLMENNDLYFSASDNQPGDHEYSIISPVIIRNRYLLACFCLAAFALAAILFPALKHKNISFLQTLIRSGSLLFFLLLLIPWDKMIFSGTPHRVGPFLFKPLLRRNPYFLLLLAAFLLLSIKIQGKSRALSAISVFVVLMNTVFYFVPEWNYYGQRADSPAYLEHYSASSIRTPGYPVFIESVYKLSGNDGLDELRSAGAGITDERLYDGQINGSLGLLTVIRTQKIILGAAFLILFAVFCLYYPPVWFAFTAQIILCGGFLGVDNSYIMTECLSQAVCLLITSFFLLTMKEKKSLFFLCVCILAGIGMLIRPANLFLVIPIGFAFIMLLLTKQNMLLPVLGCLAFAGITAIPAATIYREYHTFVWMPISGYVEIARAVELLQPGDLEAFEDPELRTFTEDLLRKKEELGNADQNTYMWEAGVETALEHGFNKITCSPVFGKVSRKIFTLHPKEFARSLAGTMKTALERTRLQIGPVSYPWIVLLFTVLFAIRISTGSLTGMILVIMHTIHLFIFIVNQPERRYIYSTEIFCLLGWMLILINLIQCEKLVRNQLKEGSLFRR